jgi:hypothetical protein
MVNKILRTLIALTFLLTSTPVSAKVGIPDARHWEFAWYGGGGAFPMIVPDNFVAGKFYMVSDVGNVMVTTDYGDHWTWLTYDSASGYAVEQNSAFLQSKNDHNLMFVLGGGQFRGGIQKSTNGGQSWKKVSSIGGTRSSTSKAIIFNPSLLDTELYAAFNNGWVLRSQDTGETWQNLFRPFATDVTSESAELTGTTNTRTGSLNNTTNIVRGSITFTSSGETFTDSITGTSGVLTGSAGGSGTINYTNGAYTLKFFNTPTTTTVAYTYAPKAYWLYMTKDGTKLYAGNSSGLRVYDVLSQTTSTVTLAPTTTGSFTTPRFNTTYDTYTDNSNVEHLCVNAGVQIGCTGDPENGVSATWTYTTDAKPAPTASGGFRIERFAVHYRSNGSVRYVAFTQTFPSSSSASVVRYSPDGITWSTSGLTRNTAVNPTFPGAGGPVGESITADPNDENRFFFTTNFTAYRSDDGGASFFEKVAGAGQTVLSDIKVAPDGTLVGCNMDVGCQKSVDHGTTWTNIFPKNPPDPGIPYIGGHFWQTMILGSKADWEAGNGRIIMTSNYWYDFIPRVHRCINNGTTCTTTKLTAIDGKTINIGLYGDVIWDRGYIRALGKSADETVLYVGTDGANCDADGSGPLPSDGCVSSGNNHVFGGLFKSVDDGLSWQQVWTTPNKIYNALKVDPTDITGKKLLFGTFAYNLYRAVPYTENAELNGSGQTRTGTLNHVHSIVSKSVTFTSSTGETFTDNTLGVLTSSLGGTGTVNYSTGAYSLTFVSAPATTSVSYLDREYVSASNYIFDVAYDSKGHPYASGSSSGAVIYKSDVTTYGNGDGAWGTWTLMKRFFPTNVTNGIADGIAIDPMNDNRIAVATINGTGGSITGNRIFMTTDAQNSSNATWYDITFDMPAQTGCSALAFDYFQGNQGYLLCSTSNGLFKIPLDDSVDVEPGLTGIGVE